MYKLHPRDLSGRGPVSLEKVPVKESLSSISLAAAFTLEDQRILIITARAYFAVWDLDHEKLLHYQTLASLKDIIAADEMAVHSFTGAAVCQATGELLIGTSWGDVLRGGLGKGDWQGSKGLRRHKQAITALACEGHFLLSCDDAGTVIQWDLRAAAGAAEAVIQTYPGNGYPATTVSTRGDAAVVGFADGKLKILRLGFPVLAGMVVGTGGSAGAGAGSAASSSSSAAPKAYLEAEVCAHARAVTAVRFHPLQYSVSGGEG